MGSSSPGQKERREGGTLEGVASCGCRVCQEGTSLVVRRAGRHFHDREQQCRRHRRKHFKGQLLIV